MRPRPQSARPWTKSLLAALSGALLLGHASAASAQQPPPPPPPPPGFEQQQPQPQPGQPPPGQPPPPAPPPGYYPPPGYGYPYGYGAAPPGIMLGPKTMDYEEGDPVPAGYHVETRVRKGLIIGGAVTFGALYLISALTAASVERTNNDDFVPLYIPAVGPFITIGSADSEGVGTFFLIVDGVAQSGGLLMAILGIAVQQDLLVRNDVGKNEPSVTVAPMMVGKGSVGFGLVGSM